jgi:hypothetical protein
MNEDPEAAEFSVEESLTELSELVGTAGLEVAGSTYQKVGGWVAEEEERRRRRDPSIDRLIDCVCVYVCMCVCVCVYRR